MNPSLLHFAHPELAPILWTWLAFLILLVVLERRGSDALDRLVGGALQDRLVDRPSSWRRWVRIALLGVAGAAMALAMMQPQMGERYVSTPRVGAEIMIALDVSRSMLADDAKPSRLERAKAEIRDLLSYLGDDYVGLIAFAGRASVLSPMTPDKSFLRLALDSAGPHSVSRGGTKLAEPIRRAVAGLGEPGPAQRALILITDGEDHDSFALDAAKAAAEAGIKIIAIGFGDEGGSPIYIRDPQTGARSQVRDADGNAVVSRLNGDLLRELALATDGAFVPAGTGVLDLASIYDVHIAPLTRGQLDERGRTIRDEVYQIFLLVAFVCLVAAIFITRGAVRSPIASTGGSALLCLLLVISAAPRAEAQSAGEERSQTQTPLESFAESTIAELLPGDISEPQVGTESTPPSGGAVTEDPRLLFNRGNAALAEGDGVRATTHFRSARRDAPDDPELRYAATYNLGMAAVLRADGLAPDNAKESLAALQEATDWFREAASMRPDESDPRHNLDVTLRRALILADEIARSEGREVDTELDALVEAQRTRVADAARLLEAVARSNEVEIDERLRPFFRDAATDQRILLAEAEELAERIVREKEAIAASPEASRTPEDALRGAQLDGVLVYLDAAIDRMGQTRRQLRQRRAERAYRRASAALGELKRARDQLRDPVQQIGVLLQEVGTLVGATEALEIASRPPALAVPGTPDAQPTPTPLPAFLSAESLEEESRRLENRVRDLAVRLEQAAIDAEASAAAPPPPADPTQGGGAPQMSAADRAALREALSVAAPRVSRASDSMEGATAAIGSEQFEEALDWESKVGRLLAEAQEVFFDLRQLLDVTHADEERIAALASAITEAEPGASELPASPESLLPFLREVQGKNLERAGRLSELLARERENRLTALAAETQAATGAGGQASDPDADPTQDPAAQERERFAIAEELLARAVTGMEDAEAALGESGSKPRDPKGGESGWTRVAEGTANARDRLADLQTLFFTLIEHLKKLAVDQTDLNDRTQDVIALAVTEDSEDETDGEEEDSGSEAEQAEVRGPETQLRASRLAEEQGPLGERAGVLADALLEQAEAIAAAPEQAAGPAPAAGEEAPQDRMRRAAEHVARAQQAMVEATDVLGDEAAAPASAQEPQVEAVEEIHAALELLAPPPPPEEQSQDEESQQQEQEQSGESDAESEPPPESGQDESAEASENQPAEEEEGPEDPSELLQGVRDREAERRRDQERDQERRRSQAVERDW